MENIIIMASIIAPITTGIVEAIKKATGIRTDFIPLLSILVGTMLGGFANFLDLDIYLRLWGGAISGLASVGLFETGKQMVGGSKK